MNSMKNILRTLRKAKGVTQEEMACALNVSAQAVSKWENGAAQPDIQLLPKIAEYFSVSIDELFGYKLDALTDKEKFIRYMENNQILQYGEFELKHAGTHHYYVNTENFSTNAQIAKIGEYFADCIRENHLEFDTLVGLAYHGIAFSAAIATFLYQKYGQTVNYCCDRKVADSRGRMICGHTPKDGEKVVVIVNRGERNQNQFPGSAVLREKYGAEVFSIITDKDIEARMR